MPCSMDLSKQSIINEAIKFTEPDAHNLSLTLTQVTRWVPDHMASHCFNCDSEFWIAKRRHHCR